MDGYEKYVITSLWAYFCDATQGFFWELYGKYVGTIKKYVLELKQIQVPSGNLTYSYRKSPFLIGKPSINGVIFHRFSTKFSLSAHHHIVLRSFR